MLTYIFYTIAFALIGLAVGFVGRRYMWREGSASGGHMSNPLVGAAGGLVGGLAWLALRGYGWSANDSGSQGLRPEASVYSSADSAQTQLPGYWVGLLAALITALLALALYKLLAGRKTHT